MEEGRCISIHAPVKGATQKLIVESKGRFISIHAPVKGATEITSFFEQTDAISIHAPVKGATSSRFRSAGHAANFNPRSREGSDRIESKQTVTDNRFQSTLP